MFKRHPVHRHILVSGCARSGTHLYCDLLNEMGFALRHELRTRDGMVSHLEGGTRRAQRYKLRIFLARNPIGIIRSCHTMRIPTWERISTILDVQLLDMPMCQRCMVYYVRWTEHLKLNMKPNVYVRIEDVKLAGNRKSRRHYPRYGNYVTWKRMARRHPELTAEVRRTALSLGYSRDELR